jgi:hypothetical protein
VVCTALRHRAVADEGGEHRVHCDQVIDHILHLPFSAWRRRIPLVGPYVGDQIAQSCACTCGILNRSGGHPGSQINCETCQLYWNRTDKERNTLGHNENSDLYR